MNESKTDDVAATPREDAPTLAAECLRSRMAMLSFGILTGVGIVETLKRSPDAHWLFLAAAAAPVAYLIGQGYANGKREEARAEIEATRFFLEGGDGERRGRTTVERAR